MNAHLIFYVEDQEKSKIFYRRVLALEPTLHVVGMTEFTLNPGCVLGLMPEKGIKRLLGNVLPDPITANGIPRAELYLKVDDPILYHSRAIEMGAKELSGPAQRSWGDIAAYSLDPDGHVLVFAKPR
jgi:catechol 2,3-dioxygenase-like lactoylglutathione lyase family enzyme